MDGYKTLDELTDEQLEELYSNAVFDVIENPSYTDIANAREIVGEARLREMYGGVGFVDDDFVCTRTHPETEGPFGAWASWIFTA